MVRARAGRRAVIGFLARIFGGTGEPPPPDGDPVRIAEVEAVLAGLRPLLVADGGDVQVLAVSEEGLVRLRLVGACEHCFQSPATAEGVIAPRLRDALEWVRDVRVR